MKELYGTDENLQTIPDDLPYEEARGKVTFHIDNAGVIETRGGSTANGKCCLCWQKLHIIKCLLSGKKPGILSANRELHQLMFLKNVREKNV